MPGSEEGPVVAFQRIAKVAPQMRQLPTSTIPRPGRGKSCRTPRTRRPCKCFADENREALLASLESLQELRHWRVDALIDHENISVNTLHFK